MRKILKIMKYLFLLGLIAFITTAIAIVWVGLRDTVQKSDVIVILGNKVQLDGTPSPRLARRLDRGFELYQNETAPLIIVTGGIGIEGFDEAEVMKQYLVDKGVPEDVITVDSLGTDTFASAQNIKKIVEDKNITSVLVVSSYYHISRAVFAFEKNEIPEVYSASSNFFELRDVYSVPREVIGFYYYVLRNYE
mgnify:CR=1 FL=1